MLYQCKRRQPATWLLDIAPGRALFVARDVFIAHVVRGALSLEAMSCCAIADGPDRRPDNRNCGTVRRLLFTIHLHFPSFVGPLRQTTCRVSFLK